ncbi:carbonic anhydrase 1 [Lepeophtheirus salmonis]|uniref:carbonic anhydrase 1 n=1 Tax=Lepeophtheirus salmonis TaxID=72036 RepID=UPI001AE635FB|nr:carbonic anhydrase-like [Lepeophtheirus salmonis]XP_040574563.1 carbonic anhydrase-like [Lepeophtheirus salmonis]
MTTRLLVCLTVLSTISGWRSKNINGEYWKSFDIFKTCKHGRKQSPVNIIKNDASIMQCAPMNFSYYDHPNDFDILNNGHTVILTLKNGTSRIPHITGEQLPKSVFQFSQLHFHWGKNNTIGSEHQINGSQYPLEGHFVHFNTNYGSTLDEALKVKGVKDNLFVIAVLFHLSSQKSNSGLQPIIKSLKSIKKCQRKSTISKLNLRKLLPRKLTEFYSYEGSLTIPPCQEIVLWTVFKKRCPVSAGQMRTFRKVFNDGDTHMNIFRLPQPLNGRTVLYNRS